MCHVWLEGRAVAWAASVAATAHWVGIPTAQWVASARRAQRRHLSAIAWAPPVVFAKALITPIRIHAAAAMLVESWVRVDLPVSRRAWIPCQTTDKKRGPGPLLHS